MKLIILISLSIAATLGAQDFNGRDYVNFSNTNGRRYLGLWSSSGNPVQHPNGTCTSQPCTMTVSSTGVGNLLIFWSSINYTGSGGAALEFAFTGAADNGTSETWQHCPNSMVSRSGSPALAIDCWYILNSAGGATSITSTWAFNGFTGPTYAINNELIEYHPSAQPVYYDTGNASSYTSTCTSCSGPSGILQGTHDVISQAFTNVNGSVVSEITSPYNISSFPDVIANVPTAFAGSLNQSSYSVPTWTRASSASFPVLTTYVAFSLDPVPTYSPNFDWFLDMSACSNGSQLTATCLNNSTSTGLAKSVTGSGIGTNLIASTGGPSSLLPQPVIVNGVSYTGNSTLNASCTTGSGSPACGEAIAVVAGYGAAQPLAVGYTFQSSCPSNGIQDCGASGGLSGGGSSSDYATFHVSPLGDGFLCLEVFGPGCSVTPNIIYTPNKAYRIDILLPQGPNPAAVMVVCNDGPGGTVINTIQNTGTATVNLNTNFAIGFTGEEPVVAGYLYYWRNIVVSNAGRTPPGGWLTPTGCF